MEWINIKEGIKMKIICKDCGNEQQGSFEDKDIACVRCGSKNLFSYSRVIKRHFLCLHCNKHFKISELSAKRIFLTKDKLECPGCESTSLKHTTQLEYNDASGQSQRKHNTQAMTLEGKALT